MAGDTKVGLVLSGGGTRGLAHIGALKVLSRLGFEPAAISGCSIGALVGAMYASGKTPLEIEKFAMKVKIFSFLQLSIGRLGLADLKKLEKAVMGFIQIEKFSDLKIPLIVNATDIANRREIVFRDGPLWPAIRASISIPGLFTAVRRDNQVIVDGGVLDQHPFRLLPPEVSKFIMVDVSPPTAVKMEKMNLIKILQTSMAIMQDEITRLRLAEVKKDDYVVIRPELTGHYIIETEKKFKQLIEHGAAATRESIPQLRRLINK